MTTPATVPVRAVCQSGVACHCDQNSSAPTGIRMYDITRTNRMIEPISSERVTVNLRASLASRVAYESTPTRVACMRPLPDTTNEPESASSPASLATGSASPVSSDSSISRPCSSRIAPSTTIWSPVRSTMTSSRTTAAERTSTSAPSRRTRGLAAPTRDSRSRVRLARYSWTIPIPELMTMMKPNKASWIGAWAMNIKAQRTPMTTLKLVTMLARAMSCRLRLRGSGASFARPLASRSATSAAVSPRSGSVRTSATGARALTRSWTGSPGSA